MHSTPSPSSTCTPYSLTASRIAVERRFGFVVEVAAAAVAAVEPGIAAVAVAVAVVAVATAVVAAPPVAGRRIEVGYPSGIAEGHCSEAR